MHGSDSIERRTYRLVTSGRGSVPEQRSHAPHVSPGCSDDATHVHGPPHDDRDPEQEVAHENDDQDTTGISVTARASSDTDKRRLTSGIL